VGCTSEFSTQANQESLVRFFIFSPIDFPGVLPLGWGH
jgi:hypothetical protein